MKKHIICISCPIGCHLTVEYDETVSLNRDNILVQNNKCARGEIYGKEEILAPKRVVTATCAIESVLMSRVPVKTSGALLKEEINGLLDELYSLNLKAPVKMGDVIIKNYNNSSIDIITTRSLSK